MINFTFKEEKNTVYIERFGDVHLPELLEHVNKMDEALKGRDDIHLLEDIRQSKVMFTQKDYPELVDFVKKRAGIYKEIRHAIVVTDPHDTALSILYQMAAMEIGNYTFKIFSTPEEAKKWIEIGRR